jgi:hypothetical protein
MRGKKRNNIQLVIKMKPIDMDSVEYNGKRATLNTLFSPSICKL